MCELSCEAGYQLFIQEGFVGREQQLLKHASQQQGMEKMRHAGREGILICLSSL